MFFTFSSVVVSFTRVDLRRYLEGMWHVAQQSQSQSSVFKLVQVLVLVLGSVTSVVLSVKMCYVHPVNCKSVIYC